MSETVTLILVAELGSVSKGFEQKLVEWKTRGKIDTIHTAAFLRSAKIKESEKIDKYLDLTRRKKKRGKHEGDGDTNCKLCARNGFRMFIKKPGGIVDQGRMETIQTIELQRSARKFKRVLETCCLLDSSERSPANAGAKKSQRDYQIVQAQIRICLRISRIKFSGILRYKHIP